MNWVLAFHIIFMVAWFAGLFYLPRLFVYHTMSQDEISIARFKVMEKKLFYFIMTPAAILTTLLGLILLGANFHYYIVLGWMQVKLFLVLLLWIYHVHCGVLVQRFKQDRNSFSPKFYRFFNEVPTILLILIVIMVIIRP